MACDHLCHLGYDMAQVEEALEMFQNCETKVRHAESELNITQLSNILRDNKCALFLEDSCI